MLSPAKKGNKYHWDKLEKKVHTEHENPGEKIHIILC